MSPSRIAFVTLIFFSLLSCGDSPQEQRAHSPVSFNSGDECHVCGMIITRIAGPKGQAYDNRSKQVKKFCSTVDLVSWYLQPENKPNVSDIYVHDMAETDWNSPDDSKLINARKAFFVIDSKKKGSMGKSIVSFENKSNAEHFAKQWGGSIINFEQLTLSVIFAQ